MLVRRWLVVLAAGAAAVLLAVPAQDAPAASPARTHTAAITLAPGVTTWRDSWHNARGRQVQAVLLQARLGRHVALQARTPGQLIGLNRNTLTSMARRAGAVAGVNADFFDFTTDAAVPRGAVIKGGRVLKSPRANRLANLYVRADGHAAVGAIDFAYSVTRPATAGRPSVTRRIHSINAIDDALNDRLVYVDHEDVGGYVDRGCAIAAGRTVAGTSTVAAVTRTDSVTRPVVGGWALVGCAGAADWLRANLRAGDQVRLTLSYPKGTPLVAVTGRRELVRNGAAFDDPTGPPLSTWGPNPETFGCVSKDGLTVLLGAIDGRERDSAGVTYTQLTDYMLRLHCWSGLVFDGGGSTELVARLPGHATATVQNHPAGGEERRIADALVVVTH